MARENQGLQIALIIFVILTVLLGGATYYFFSEYRAADIDCKTALGDARQKGDTNLLLQEQINDSKKLMGFTADYEWDKVQTDFQKDMEAYSADNPPESYRDLVAQLVKKISVQQVDINRNTTTIARLDKTYNDHMKAKTAEVDKFASTLDTYKKDLDTKTAAFQARQQQTVAHDEEVNRTSQQMVGVAEAARKKAESDRDDLDAGNEGLRKRVKEQADKINQLTTETFEVPDGEVVSVDYRKGIVFIDLGRADGLSRQVSFSVYPFDTTNLARGGKKASIEVTKILDDHSAEARITDQNITDPILPGDKVHTPVWNRGERKRFALTGLLDVDGDDKGDLEIVRNLITMNGGIVDAWLDENGKRHGEITSKTRFLVLGKEPTVSLSNPNAKQEFINGNTAMRAAAEEKGIPMISLDDLLRNMGWKNQMSVVRMGRGGNFGQNTGQAPKAVPRTSSGNVSGIFTDKGPAPPPRKRSAPGGAY